MSIFNAVRPFGAPRIHMDENATGGSEPAPIVREAPTNTGTDLSISEAAKVLANVRRKPPASVEPSAPAAAEPVEPSEPTAAESADPATAETELSVEDNTDPAEKPAPGENEDKDAEAEKLPPVNRPRSWAKEEQAEWEALPRSLQEKIAAREESRDKGVRQSQNEAAEKSKALIAKEQAAEQARTQYESKLASVREILENEQRRDFPDIKSQQDLDNIAAKITELSGKAQQLWATDPLAAGPLQAEAMQLQGKLQAWDNHQRKLQGVDREQKAAEQRKATEQRDSWTKHINEQNALAAEKISDLKDADKGKVLRQRAVETLSQLGFTPDELNKLASGEEKISVFDHRLQQLLHASLRLADIEKAKATVAAKVAKIPVPPVVKPGTSQPGNPAESQNLKSLNAKLTKDGGVNDAVAVLLARRASTARRAAR